jgi:hypothetical protein
VRLEGYTFRDKSLSSEEWINRLVDFQFERVRDNGVETFGFFRDVLGTLRHRTCESEVIVRVDLEGARKEVDGNSLKIAWEVNPKEPFQSDIFLEYHSHPVPRIKHPSFGDLIITRDKGLKSIVIATRADRDGFRISDWLLRPHVDLQRLLAEMKYNGSNPFNWIKGWTAPLFVGH